MPDLLRVCDGRAAELHDESLGNGVGRRTHVGIDSHEVIVASVARKVMRIGLDRRADAHLLDIAPTVLDLLGIASRRGCAGGACSHRLLMRWSQRAFRFELRASGALRLGRT